MIELNKAELAALIGGASKDRRPHLSCVCFDGPRGAVVSTDGHALMSVWSEPYHHKMVLIGRDMLTRVSQAMGSKSVARFDGRKVTVTDAQNGKPAKIGSLNITMTLPTVDAQFPPYLSVLPGKQAKKSSGRVGVDPKLTARTCSALCAAAGEGAVQFETRGTFDPVRVSARNERRARTWVAVIMPMRIDETKPSPAEAATRRALEDEADEQRKRNEKLKRIKDLELAAENAKKAAEIAEEAARAAREGAAA